MKVIQLNEKWCRKLTALPETGMGSQHVDFVLKDKRIVRDVIVFNCEECHSEVDFDPEEIVDVLISVR